MMKKRILNYVLKGTIVVALPLLMGSCIGYYGVGYDDGIYGERPVRYVSESPRYETPDPRGQHSQGSYKAYLQEKANGYQEFQNKLQPSYTPFADVNNYRTPADNQRPTYNSYAGWGENPRQTSVNIYNYAGGWGYDPYWDWNYRHSYFWGAGAWYPYSYYYPYYGYNYYYPYRSGWSFSIGTYSPYWNWRYGYGSYYRGYYYSDYYYPYYTNRYDNRYYRNYQADGYYYDNNKNRYRADEYRNYYQYQNNRTQSYDNNRSYNRQQNYDAGRYERSYNTQQPQTRPRYQESPSPSYNSNRSYDAGRYSSPSSSSSGNGGSTGRPQRDY